MRKLGRKKDNRDHMMRNLAASLVLYETIDTTEEKAKEVKTFVDKIIVRSKKNDLSSKRFLFATFFDNNAAKKIINELAPRYKERTSGFVKSYHLKNRLGDNASMMRLELIDKKVFVQTKNDKEKTKNEAK